MRFPRESEHSGFLFSERSSLIPCLDVDCSKIFPKFILDFCASHCGPVTRVFWSTAGTQTTHGMSPALSRYSSSLLHALQCKVLDRTVHSTAWGLPMWASLHSSVCVWGVDDSSAKTCR